MNVLVLGDTHGDGEWFNFACKVAKASEADTILQLGDMGFWEHTGSGNLFLNQCERSLEENDLDCIWIDGNHENHTLLRKRYGPGGMLHEPKGNLWKIRERLHHAPRGARFYLGGRSFLACGGAYSIDKAYRTEGSSWWSEEEITWNDVDACGTDVTDVLLSHDAPLCGAHRGKAVPQTERNRTKLQKVVDNTNPRLVVHGHYHVRYTEEVENRFMTIVGLGCDGSTGSMGVLNLNTLQVRSPVWENVNAEDWV